jgi:holo-[acyl-carrier protein] synthase
MNSSAAQGHSHDPSSTSIPGWQLAFGEADTAGAIGLVTRLAAGIHSAGVDLVDVTRFRRAVTRSGEPFVRRVFGERERAGVSRDPDQRIFDLAALFGVKESVVKAIGGMPLGGNWADICVQAGGGGSTYTVRLYGELAGWARRHGVELIAGSAPAGDGLLLCWALALRAGELAAPTGKALIDEVRS